MPPAAYTRLHDSGDTVRGPPGSVTDTVATCPRSASAVLRNSSEFDLGGWRFEAKGRGLRVKATVSARPEDLVGVTYHDPDGDLAYCYNTEVADMLLEVFRRRSGGWTQTGELRADGRAHFEYAQRTPIEGLALKIA